LRHVAIVKCIFGVSRKTEPGLLHMAHVREQRHGRALDRCFGLDQTR
jgi:hypothetical protein